VVVKPEGDDAAPANKGGVHGLFDVEKSGSHTAGAWVGDHGGEIRLADVDELIDIGQHQGWGRAEGLRRQKGL